MSSRRALASGGFTATLCLACCAPPIVAALGVTTGFAILAVLFVGLTAAVTVVLLGVAAIEVRHRHRRACTLRRPTGAVPVAPTPRH